MRPSVPQAGRYHTSGAPPQAGAPGRAAPAVEGSGPDSFLVDQLRADAAQAKATTAPSFPDAATADLWSQAWAQLHADASRYALDTALARLDELENLCPDGARAAALGLASERRRLELREQLAADLEPKRRRRLAERALADRLDQVADRNPGANCLYRFDRMAEKMRACRHTGTVMVDREGRRRCIHDEKCGLLRYCPDESHEEAVRVLARYLPHVEAWQRERAARRRIFAVTPTVPNVPAEGLAAGIDGLWRRWRRLWRGCRPGALTRGQDAQHPRIDGALMAVESPLAADCSTWNVHAHGLLLVDGPLDYRALRAAWGCNIEIRQVKANSADLAAALAETVKYAARQTAAKVDDHAEAGEGEAPPMVEWPDSAIVEHHAAHAGTRRLRTYGCLHGVEDPDPVYLVDPQPVARISWSGTAYAVHLLGAGPVDSIQGDNSTAREAGEGGNGERGPPKEPAAPSPARRGEA